VTAPRGRRASRTGTSACWRLLECEVELGLFQLYILVLQAGEQLAEVFIFSGLGVRLRL